MAHRNVGRSIPYLTIQQVGCHHESPKGFFNKNILSLAKPILPDFAYAVITPICEIGVGIGIQRLRKFLTVNHVMMATDYPHFDSEYPHTVSGIRERKDLTPKQKDKILGENAAKLLNL